VTARTTDQTPANAAPGVAVADSSSAANRLMYRVPPASLERTVFDKEQPAPAASPQPKVE